MSLLRQIAEEAARPRYIAVGPFVLRVRQVRALDLARVGHLHLEGSSAYRAWQQERQQHIEEQWAGVNDPELSDEERSRRQKDIAAKYLAPSVYEWIQHAPDAPASTQALLDRIDAYLCAGITGVAVLADEAAEAIDRDTGGMPLVHVFPDGTDPKDLAAPPGSDTVVEADGFEALRVCRDSEEQDIEGGVLWVQSLFASDLDRVFVGSQLLALQEVVARVPGAFRRQPWRDATAGRNGAEVGPAPE